jgi:hypothetical protein
MRWLHIHHDRHWEQRGVHGYYQCRCGARRTIWINIMMWGPVEDGWPLLTDKHNRPTTDSGWQTVTA